MRVHGVNISRKTLELITDMYVGNIQLRDLQTTRKKTTGCIPRRTMIANMFANYFSSTTGNEYNDLIHMYGQERKFGTVRRNTTEDFAFKEQQTILPHYVRNIVSHLTLDIPLASLIEFLLICSDTQTLRHDNIVNSLSDITTCTTNVQILSKLMIALLGKQDNLPLQIATGAFVNQESNRHNTIDRLARLEREANEYLDSRDLSSPIPWSAVPSDYRFVFIPNFAVLSQRFFGIKINGSSVRACYWELLQIFGATGKFSDHGWRSHIIRGTANHRCFHLHDVFMQRGAIFDNNIPMVNFLRRCVHHPVFFF